MAERMSYSFSASEGPFSPQAGGPVQSSDHPAPEQLRSKMESVAQDYSEFHIECTPVSQSLPSLKNATSHTGGTPTQTKKRMSARGFEKIKQFWRVGIMRKEMKESQMTDIVQPPNSG